jgi:glycosyltransferase involved in cell wall biosynthesis
LAGWIATGLKRFALRRATAVTVPNQEMRERLLQLGANPSTTLLRPMGADVAAVRAVRAERRGGKLLFAGRLAEKKGVAVLLEALCSADLGDDWSLDVVGDGPLRPRLEAAARPVPAARGRRAALQAQRRGGRRGRRLLDRGRWRAVRRAARQPDRAAGRGVGTP